MSRPRECPDCGLFLSADHTARPAFDGIRWEHLSQGMRLLVTAWHRAHGGAK